MTTAAELVVIGYAMTDFVRGSGISSDELRDDAVEVRDLLTAYEADPEIEITTDHVALGWRITDFVQASGETSDQLRADADIMAVELEAAYGAQEE